MSVGEQLARIALDQGQTSESIALVQRESRRLPVLTADQVANAFAGRCSLETARAIAARLGRMLVLRGWRWTHKRTFADVAREARMTEETAGIAVRALNEFSVAPGNLRLTTLERVLSTCEGAHIEVFGGPGQ